MMTLHSRQESEAHSLWRSVFQTEPPTDASFPSLEEEVCNQRSMDEWGNMMGKTRGNFAACIPEYWQLLARGGYGSQI